MLHSGRTTESLDYTYGIIDKRIRKEIYTCCLAFVVIYTNENMYYSYI